MLKTQDRQIKTDGIFGEEDPSSVNICELDSMFVVQSQVDLPTTYGAMTNSILRRILSTATTCIDFICDSYKEGPSIKDAEHTLRGASEGSSEFIISGPEPKRPHELPYPVGFSPI